MIGQEVRFGIRDRCLRNEDFRHRVQVLEDYNVTPWFNVTIVRVLPFAVRSYFNLIQNLGLDNRQQLFDSSGLGLVSEQTHSAA